MEMFNQKITVFFQNRSIAYAGLISLTHTILSFFTDRLIFAQDARSGIRYLIFKLLFFFVSFTVWYFIIVFFKKLFIDRKGGLMIYLKIFLFFFAFYSTVLFLIYPGNFIWSEKTILEKAVYLRFHEWQHILTSVFYILSLMVFPMPVIVVIMQYTIISTVIAYFIGTLYNRGRRKYLLSGILFILPPVLVHVFYPMRLSIFAFIELLFFFIINEKKRIVGKKKMLFVMGLNIILAVWRTECIFFITFLPIYLIYKKYPVKATVIVTTILIGVSGMLSAIQNHYLDENKIGYTVTGLVRPFHELLIEDYEINDGKLIEEVDDIIDVLKAVQYSNGESAYWANAYDGVDTKDKLKRMEYVFLKLAKKYPLVLLKERYSTFHISEKLLDKDGNICNMLGQGNIYMDGVQIGKVLSGFIKSKPLNMSIRAKVLLCLYSKGGYPIIDNIIRFTYSLILPIILLIIMLIYSIIKRNVVLLLSILFLLAQTAIVFITAPLSLFMYYFPIYMCSYGLFIEKFHSVFAKLYKSIKKRC